MVAGILSSHAEGQWPTRLALCTAHTRYFNVLQWPPTRWCVLLPVYFIAPKLIWPSTRCPSSFHCVPLCTTLPASSPSRFLHVSYFAGLASELKKKGRRITPRELGIRRKFRTFDDDDKGNITIQKLINAIFRHLAVTVTAEEAARALEVVDTYPRLARLRQGAATAAAAAAAATATALSIANSSGMEGSESGGVGVNGAGNGGSTATSAETKTSFVGAEGGVNAAVNDESGVGGEGGGVRPKKARRGAMPMPGVMPPPGETPSPSQKQEVQEVQEGKEGKVVKEVGEEVLPDAAGGTGGAGGRIKSQTEKYQERAEAHVSAVPKRWLQSDDVARAKLRRKSLATFAKIASTGVVTTGTVRGPLDGSVAGAPFPLPLPEPVIIREARWQLKHFREVCEAMPDGIVEDPSSMPICLYVAAWCGVALSLRVLSCCVCTTCARFLIVCVSCLSACLSVCCLMFLVTGCSF